tara:strand:+ start:286 stop:1128 length:843 start_codon:yes stop_codon:yes gene_type:complete
MSLKKKISIKPIHLMVGSKKEKKKKKREKKSIESLFKPNKVKKELLEKIKKHQQNKKNAIEEGGTISKLDSFTDNFQESLLYLNNVSKNRKNKTLRKNEIKPNNSYVPPPTPKYGILKGGKKPLYSEYRKTMKRESNPHSKLKFNLETSLPVQKPLFVTERQNKLKEIKQQINPEPPKKKVKAYKKTKTLKKKLILGKKNGKISVLIKNRKTRKKIKNETLKLKKKSLEEIKQYLRIHNLIKIGSDAPEDLLRETFENAFLSGNIFNKNTENLIHNYINV